VSVSFPPTSALAPARTPAMMTGRARQPPCQAVASGRRTGAALESAPVTVGLVESATNAERQRRYRARVPGPGAAAAPGRSPRPKRWVAALAELRILQAEYEAWRDQLPKSLAAAGPVHLPAHRNGWDSNQPHQFRLPQDPPGAHYLRPRPASPAAEELVDDEPRSVEPSSMLAPRIIPLVPKKSDQKRTARSTTSRNKSV